MSKKYYQSGNTVRLECKFHDYQNQPVNPQLVKLTIYNYKYEVLETFTVSNSGVVGHYSYDYTTEDNEGRYYYEWYGEIGGNPYLKRDLLQTRFV